MKRKLIYPVLVLLVSVGFYYWESYIDQHQNKVLLNEAKEKAETSFFFLPTSTTGVVVTNKYYTLSYSEKHEQPEWVAYHLKKEHITRQDFKRPYFEIDKKVPTGAADWRNYKKSGYDKGHLCPAADRGFSYEAFEETFLTSNISPQNHGFNSGIWNDLEKQTRYWAKKYNGLYVITGGILKDNLKTIGYEAVSVPDYFYKILLDYKENKEPKMIAFLIPNKDTNDSFRQYVVTVDILEEKTGIDFFAKLPDPIESKLESKTRESLWGF